MGYTQYFRVLRLLASAAERCLTRVHVIFTVRGFEHMSQDTMSEAQYVLH